MGRVSSLAGRLLSPGATLGPRGARVATIKASIHEISAVTAAFSALSENAATGAPRSGFRVQAGRMIAQEESLSALPTHSHHTPSATHEITHSATAPAPAEVPSTAATRDAMARMEPAGVSASELALGPPPEVGGGRQVDGPGCGGSARDADECAQEPRIAV